MLCFHFQKKTQKRRKTHYSSGFCRIYQKTRSENQTFQRIPNFIMADFYEMDFMKRNVILINIDEMYKILESLLTNRFWSRDKGGIG